MHIIQVSENVTILLCFMCEFSTHLNGYEYLRATGREFSFKIKMTSQPSLWSDRARNKYDINVIVIEIALFCSIYYTSTRHFLILIGT